MLISFNKSLIVNPQSAIIATPGLSFSISSNPQHFVNSTSEIEPTYNGDTKKITPFGVQATKNLNVLCYLHWDQIKDCMCKSVGVSIKISLVLIMVYVVG